MQPSVGWVRASITGPVAFLQGLVAGWCLSWLGQGILTSAMGGCERPLAFGALGGKNEHI
jgi:hypothetical protein